ncbi:hypothetical protein MXB_1006, partial [Myxobolus squamalis]
MASDCVYFDIFDIRTLIKTSENAKLFKKIKNDVIQIIRKLSSEYLWEHNMITVEISEKNVLHLHGTHFHGGCLDDEYQIASILLEISQMSEAIFIRIYDSDGEFLLIDCPIVSDNSFATLEKCLTYIHANSIIIFPDDNTSVEMLDSSLQIFNKNAKQLLLSQRLTCNTINRISKLNLNQHNIILLIPHKIAYLLDKCPQLITEIVHHFDEKCYKTQILVKTESDRYSDSLVQYRVGFSKSLFAQLVSHNFIPHSKSTWWKSEKSCAPSLAFILGYKITVGFVVYINSLLSESK